MIASVNECDIVQFQGSVFAVVMAPLLGCSAVELRSEKALLMHSVDCRHRENLITNSSLLIY